MEWLKYCIPTIRGYLDRINVSGSSHVDRGYVTVLFMTTEGQVSNMDSIKSDQTQVVAKRTLVKRENQSG